MGQDGAFYLMEGQYTFTQNLVDIEQNLWAFQIMTGNRASFCGYTS
jgi:hypothetical protein